MVVLLNDTLGEIRARLAAFEQDEDGATAIEYGLIAGLIGLAIVGALSSTGGGVSEKWNAVANTVSATLR